MASEFEIRAGARAAMQAHPGMGEFAGIQIARAVIEAIDRARNASASTITEVCRNENCPRGGRPVELIIPGNPPMK